MVISAEPSFFIGLFVGTLITFAAFLHGRLEKTVFGMLGLTEEGLENKFAKLANAFTTKLEQDAKAYQEIADLRREQVDTVVQVFRGEIKSEGRRSFWVSFWVQLALGFFFLILGIVTTLLVT